MDDLLAFHATFMDELVSLSGGDVGIFFKSKMDIFALLVVIYAKNAKKTRKKHEIFTHIY